ncbi:KH domain-containing, RNA-binding, signal transduction-associated protein 2-like [Atheta coriaria]|uniref:KH domain-containing, RNA-binding, signal transduction-associated protein 2-like n=1 Tax=Dalotia coriaria TaxID=877792 RepID=UPI0031F3B11A
MGDKYDSNGEYANYSGDFKRERLDISDADSRECRDGVDEENEESNPASQKVSEYISELLAEKQGLDPNKFANVFRLIDQEINKATTQGRMPSKELKYVDIYRERPIKVAVKVLVPVREHPKFNFVGKLLGPKGNSMKRLQEETLCKMAVLGRGSMKDRQKEEELRLSCNPKYAHLSDDLHVEISALGPPAEAHARVAYALAEVRKYLIPDNNDNIRQEQMREMEIMTSTTPEEGSRSSRRTALIRTAMPRPPVQMRTATRTPVITPRVMPAKTKILSILDRARIAMEETYGFEEPFESSEPPYRYSSPPPTTHYRSSSSSHHYDTEYEPSYYRESSYGESSSHRWKPYKGSSASSSRHSESSRYRSSPYTRPAK